MHQLAQWVAEMDAASPKLGRRGLYKKRAA
jgi:hypothetical protein